MQMQTAISHAIENAEFSLHGESLAVTDSKSKDSVTIRGLDRLQVIRELRWFVRYRSGSHNETARERQLLTDALQDLQKAVKTTLDELNPAEAEEVAS
jgi:hypothetical protein